MPNIPLTALGRALALALALAASPASADPPGARAAEEAARRVFRDWRIACAPAGCRAATTVSGRDGAEVLTLAADADALVLTTPLPLHLPDGITLALGDEPPRALPWRTCRAAVCEARAPLDALLLDALRRERAAEVTLTLEDGVRIRLRASLLGFTASHGAVAGGGATSP